ncbi:MAG TPA: ATP-binding cassette domain-containing protein, partial [Halanaerobiales bacterium]|nr:ATP-binding cassette domain-containing protein [Halanaerobiales bacterium]
KKIKKESKLHDINLNLYPGEILSIGGLEGHGQGDFLRGLAGLAPFDSGKIILEGEPLAIEVPIDAIKKGIIYLPENRHKEGLVLPLNLVENTLLITNALKKYKFLSQRKEEINAQKAMSKLAVKTTAIDDSINALSGGNQQKVLFAKCLKEKPGILLLHEPTRGVDIQTKVEIYSLIQSVVKKGTSVILVTSDMTEIINLSNRIAVFYEGKLMGILKEKNNFTEEKIMSLAVGEGALV